MTLRRSLGAIAAAALAVAVLTAGDMTVTDLLSVRTYAEEAYPQYQAGNGPGAAAVALPPLVVLGALILLGARALLRADPARVLSALGPAAGLAAGPLAGPGRAGGRRRRPGASWPCRSSAWSGGPAGSASAAPGRPPSWSLAGLAGTLGASAWRAVSPADSRGRCGARCCRA